MSKDITATDTVANIKSSTAAKALVSNAGEGIKKGGKATGKGVAIAAEATADATVVAAKATAKFSCRLGRAFKAFGKTLVAKEQK